MEKTINRDYIFKLVDRITQPAPYRGPDPLFRLKQRVPACLRSILFSWINPFYVFYIYRQALRDRNQLNYRMRNTFTVSFMTYCFQEEYSLDLQRYYPEQDHETIEKYVENRAKSLFVDRLPLQAFSDEPDLELKIEKGLAGIVKEHKDGSYSWKLGEKLYHISSHPEVSATYYKLGLPRLPDEIQEKLAGTIFLDGGAFNGDTAIALLPYHPEAIWCIEPDDLNFELLNETIRKNALDSVLLPYKLGIGDREYQASFDNSGIMGSKIVDQGESSIHVQTIDKLTEACESRIGLIKLDIEGFELEALQGAEQTIRKHHPLLIISAYHTGKDFFGIPPLLKEFFPDYVLRFFDLEPNSPMLGEKMIIAYAE